MRGTTDEIRTEITRINRVIAQIEAKPRQEWQLWAETLQHLRAERNMLDLVVCNRQLEAKKKIVSLRRWRDGPGAA
jgi:hypothetical protein